MLDYTNRAIRQAKDGRASGRDYQSPAAIDLLIKQLETAAEIDEANTRHNGWTNRETWALALHIDNSEWSHNTRNEILHHTKAAAGKRKNPDDSPWTNEEYVRFHFADKLKEWVEDMFETVFSNAYHAHRGDMKLMVQDVGSLWRVNWQEIADNWIRDSE